MFPGNHKLIARVDAWMVPPEELQLPGSDVAASGFVVGFICINNRKQRPQEALPPWREALFPRSEL